MIGIIRISMADIWAGALVIIYVAIAACLDGLARTDTILARATQTVRVRVTLYTRRKHRQAFRVVSATPMAVERVFDTFDRCVRLKAVRADAKFVIIACSTKSVHALLLVLRADQGDLAIADALALTRLAGIAGSPGA